MNKRMISMLSAVALLGGAGITQFEAQASDVEVVATEKSEVVNIPDPNLKRVINDYLRKSESYNPTIADLESLRVLHLQEENITSLEGLQYATNLDSIYLSNGDMWDSNEENYNNITDLTPISQLYNLSFLNLSGNDITDLSPLKDLINLEGLIISRTKVSDISALENLSKLSMLSLDETEVNDITVLKNLKSLESLSLSYSKVRNLEPLTNLEKLYNLSLNGLDMSSLDAIKHLSNLYHLYIADNKLTSLDGLEKLSGLVTLDISNNKVQNADVVGMLTDLQNFYADNAGLTNTKFLSNKGLLERVSINGNHIRDFEDVLVAYYVDARDQIIILNPIEIKKGDTVTVPNPLSGDCWLEKDPFYDIEPITVKNGIYNSDRNEMIWENVQDDVLEFDFIQLFGNDRGPSQYTGTVQVPVNFVEESEPVKLGWVKENNTWYYFKQDGMMATGWEKVNGIWYYFNKSGAMQTGWLKEGSTWYYLKSSGAMATGWEKVNGTWYYLNKSGAMQTGWLKEGSTWYYLKSSGAMATGWEKVNGTWYYFNGSGKMATSGIIDGWKITSSGAAYKL